LNPFLTDTDSKPDRRPAMTLISTIGYEGSDSASFDNALRRASIDTLVDIRAVAVSRRKGFSKSALRERIAAQGVTYVHLKGLGDPKPGREAARSGNMTLFRAIFGRHLTTPDAMADLAHLRSLVKERRVALLCYEADAASCHRNIVAQRIAMLENATIVHLRVDQWGPGAGDCARTDDHFGEGLAAA
jgi:uncharacterized protein (DUF488 family)